MSARIEGQISIDVYDYNDDLQIIADCEDIVEIMEGNSITAGEMIDYLRDGAYSIDIDEVYQWLEVANVPTLCAVSKKCTDLLRHEYTEAEEGRQAYMKRANQLEQWHSESEQKLAEQKVTTGGPHVREI
jgi:Fe2+ transport system protein B